MARARVKASGGQAVGRVDVDGSFPVTRTLIKAFQMIGVGTAISEGLKRFLKGYDDWGAIIVKERAFIS